MSRLFIHLSSSLLITSSILLFSALCKTCCCDFSLTFHLNSRQRFSARGRQNRPVWLLIDPWPLTSGSRVPGFQIRRFVDASPGRGDGAGTVPGSDFIRCFLPSEVDFLLSCSRVKADLPLKIHTQIQNIDLLSPNLSFNDCLVSKTQENVFNIFFSPNGFPHVPYPQETERHTDLKCGLVCTLLLLSSV